MPVPVGDIALKVFGEMEKSFKLAPFVETIAKASDWRGRLSAIRDYYRAYLALTGEPADINNPYSSGIDQFMTPIERSLWQDIRGFYLPMTLQYPVGRFTLDFADPKRKIGIEADGAGFHDQARDAARDADLRDRHGWTVYRLTGAECKRSLPSPAQVRGDHTEQFGGDSVIDESELWYADRRYYLTTATGFIRSLATIEYKRGDIDADNFGDLMRESLAAHRLA